MRPTTGVIRSQGEIIGFVICPAELVHDLPNALRRCADEAEAVMIQAGFEMDPPK